MEPPAPSAMLNILSTSRIVMTIKKVSEQECANPEDCLECGDSIEKDPCPKSKKPCGHHCNHSWTHDVCCYCGKLWGEET